jgi:hypothetical protein
LLIALFNLARASTPLALTAKNRAISHLRSTENRKKSLAFGDFAPGMPAIRDDNQQHQREQDPEQDGQHHSGCRVKHMTLRLGEHGLDRFAGCANELSVCANRVEE